MGFDKGVLSNTFGQRALFATNGDVTYPGSQYASADVNPSATTTITSDPGADPVFKTDTFEV